jgi:hypothetical protein
VTTTGKRGPVLLKALPMGDKLVVTWLALGQPSEPQVLELDERRFTTDEPGARRPAAGPQPHAATVLHAPHTPSVSVVLYALREQPMFCLHVTVGGHVWQLPGPATRLACALHARHGQVVQECR